MTLIEEILLEFQAHGISTQGLEHALDLDFGTFEIAKLTEDPEIITLLKIVRTFPWLIDVAENSYNENEAKRIFLHHAVDLLINKRVNEKKEMDITSTNTEPRDIISTNTGSATSYYKNSTNTVTYTTGTANSPCNYVTVSNEDYSVMTVYGSAFMDNDPEPKSDEKVKVKKETWFEREKREKKLLHQRRKRRK